MDAFWFEAGSLVPPIGVGLLFWFIMRAIIRADRREREAERRAEREYLQRHRTDENDPEVTSPRVED